MIVFPEEYNVHLCDAPSVWVVRPSVQRTDRPALVQPRLAFLNGETFFPSPKRGCISSSVKRRTRQCRTRFCFHFFNELANNPESPHCYTRGSSQQFPYITRPKNKNKKHNNDTRAYVESPRNTEGKRDGGCDAVFNWFSSTVHSVMEIQSLLIAPPHISSWNVMTSRRSRYQFLHMSP